jgi:hypothetical protein
MKSPPTEDHVRIYSDNAAVARSLQRMIEKLLYPAFADISWRFMTRSLTAPAIYDRRLWKQWCPPPSISCSRGYDCLDPFGT